ncbi:hypothetical protein QQ045_029410 [Rhodiola kirilowii]
MDDTDVILASSPVDAGISCWKLSTGEELLRHRGCTSPPHGLICVAQRFLASSQLREHSSTSGSVLFWSWNKPLAEVRSFPAEPIKPLVCDTNGTYIIGGGSLGNMYIWEVATGKLLRKWHAHYRAVTSLVMLEGQSLLVSGSEDGNVRVWSLFLIFDDHRREEAERLYEHSFSEHSLPVTDIVCSVAGHNAIIVSASEDCTCKVWNISGKLLRSILFPTIINAIGLPPGEEVFYAGGRDGKIYIAALTAENSSSGSYGMHIIGSLPDHGITCSFPLKRKKCSALKTKLHGNANPKDCDTLIMDLAGLLCVHIFLKAVCCLAFDSKGVLLISGSEDGIIRVWDIRTSNIVRILKHSKGPVNNISVVRQFGSNPIPLLNRQASSRKNAFPLPPPLEKYSNDDSVSKTVVGLPTRTSGTYFSHRVIAKHADELQRQSSSVAASMELEIMKRDYDRSQQMIQQYKKLYENLHQFVVDEILAEDQVAGPCKRKKG